MSGRSFCVRSQLTDLTVTTDGEVVTNIDFGNHADRPAEERLEHQIATELQDYFSGRRKEFTFAISAQGSAFNQSVWEHVASIPYGQTTSYGEIARALGKPGAARAVGTANGRNPIPIVIPCHRVVAVGGKLGGFGGGLPLKRKLLDLECSNSPALG